VQSDVQPRAAGSTARSGRVAGRRRTRPCSASAPSRPSPPWSVSGAWPPRVCRVPLAHAVRARARAVVCAHQTSAQPSQAFACQPPTCSPWRHEGWLPRRRPAPSPRAGCRRSSTVGLVNGRPSALRRRAIATRGQQCGQDDRLGG